MKQHMHTTKNENAAGAEAEIRRFRSNKHEHPVHKRPFTLPLQVPTPHIHKGEHTLVRGTYAGCDRPLHFTGKLQLTGKPRPFALELRERIGTWMVQLPAGVCGFTTRVSSLCR